LATTVAVPTKLGECLANKEVDFTGDTFKALLTTSSYSFDQDTHKYLSSVTNEVTGTGYARVTLSSLTGPTTDAATNQTRFDAADITFVTASVSNARKCVIYDDTPGTDATRPIIEVIDFGADKDLSSGGLQIVLDAAGYFALQAT
jgi:hypothetical protein